MDKNQAKILVVGLGNPGLEYKKTLHNAGFWVVESFLEKNKTKLKTTPKVHAKSAKIEFDNQDVFCLLPQTFMNKSGLSVKAALDFWKIKPESIIIIHDDSDLPAGRIKIAFDQNPGGHNGISDIIAKLGFKNFTRIKIGIRPEKLLNTQKHLKAEKFILKETQEEFIKEVSEKAVLALEKVLEKGREEAMNLFNTK